MDTSSLEYREYLESKYLPGRRLYLHGWIYPRYLKEFVPGAIYDFGCGVGSFLEFCKRRGVPAVGIDSNPSMVGACLAHGFNAQVDDVVSPHTITAPISNVICDNVLEHLTGDRIELFFESMKSLIRKEGVLLIVVPNRKGFAQDPTHVTFVERDFIERIARDHSLSLSLKFNFPLGNRFLGERFVFNMTIYRIVF
jgi:SAM-dependent methyltransferase